MKTVFVKCDAQAKKRQLQDLWCRLIMLFSKTIDKERGKAKHFKIPTFVINTSERIVCVIYSLEEKKNH